jgi:GWxTD domain-containing protein
MRINIPGTGAVALLFATIISAQISITSQSFASTPFSQQAVLPANLFAANPSLGFDENHPADDESKKTWLRMNTLAAASPFLVDYANFIASYGLTFVEFYVQIGYDRLTFTRDGKSYRAIYDVDLYIEDMQGNLLQTQSAYDEARVNTYDGTITPSNCRITLLSFSLRPGHYRYRAIINDKESGKEYEVVNQFAVRDFSGPNLTLSDLQFSRNISIDSSGSAFVKHNRRVEPNVAHAYGQFVGHLYFYYEIYHLVGPNGLNRSAAPDSGVVPTAAADSFRTQFIVRNEAGDEVKQLWKLGRKPGNSCVQSVLLPIASLPSGAYTLIVRVFDNANGSYTEAAGSFRVQWDMLSFKDKKFEEILEQMRFVASKEEIERLVKLPEADRQRGLLDFWQRRDPTPGTPQNEAMEEYYHRINYANAYFKWRRGEGWKSPQGETYVVYGPPDYVRKYMNPAEARANDDWETSSRSVEARQRFSSRLASARLPSFNVWYEVWEYTQLNLRFVFADRDGSGIYELIDPSTLNNLGLW